ncbi:MAG: GyrI-like domain-containing protein [Clostridia bacterium]|nr:GyrI-like domain-containing protein [Clostridia bacterium]
MDFRIIDLPETSVIGKEGLCTPEKNVVQDLWAEANGNFAEVAELAKKNEEGTLVACWGAMSDESMNFRPWTESFSRGYYLAGVEVNDSAEAPKGWTKWTMPARKYLVVDVEFETYMQTFTEVLSKVIPENGFELDGAVCDFTDPANGQNRLYFPVKEI